MFVKVCGLTTKEQIDKAIEYGYDAIGIVTDIRSHRYCSPQEATRLVSHIEGRVKSFAVGFSYENVCEVANFFDYVQVYKYEGAEKITNLVLASKEPPLNNYDYFIYDASMGKGEYHELPSWLKKFSGKLLVAGGLNRNNVCNVIKTVQPYGLDVSSGLEVDGVKCFKLMKEFIDQVRSCK